MSQAPSDLKNYIVYFSTSITENPKTFKAVMEALKLGKAGFLMLGDLSIYVLHTDDLIKAERTLISALPRRCEFFIAEAKLLSAMGDGQFCSALKPFLAH